MPGIKNQVEIRIFSRRTVRLCSRHKKRRHKDAFFIKYGRGRGIRTPDILLPKQARYRTALYPGMRIAKPMHIDIMTNRKLLFASDGCMSTAISKCCNTFQNRKTASIRARTSDSKI